MINGQGHDPIDFPKLAAALLQRADSLVREWLPNGVERNGRWYIGDFDGGAGESANVNLSTGQWYDNAGTEADKGGDLISLYARIHGYSNAKAARELMVVMGWSRPQPERGRKASAPVPPPAAPAVQAPEQPAPKRRTLWRALTPVPAHAPPPDFVWRYQDGKNGPWIKLEAVRTWRYERDGQLLGYVARFERINSKGEKVKDTLQRTWCVDDKDGTCRWHWKHWEEPRPLYLPAGTLPLEIPVVVVEGEKCADALHQVLGSEFAVIAWPGGCKTWHLADWSWVAGRQVILWPDCDAQRVPLTKAEKDAGFDPATKPLLPDDKQPGIKAMVGLAAHLVEQRGCTVATVQIPAPGAVPDGWDVADAIAEGWSADLLRAKLLDAVPFALPAPESEPQPVADPTPPGDGAEPPPQDQDEAPAPKAGAKGKKARPFDWVSVRMMQRKFALIYGTDTVWDGKNHRIVKVAALRLAYGNDVVKYWLNSGDSRRTILPEQLVFEPQEEIGDDDDRINMWRGFDLQPQACEDSECEVMVELLRHLCAVSADTADEVDAIVHWVLRWIALPLQRPGTKMQTALVFHGPQGTGKNLFFDAWRDLFGSYGITVGQTELEDKFNDWLSQKLAIVGDEVVSRQEMYHHKNKLKLVVTQETKFPIRAIQQSVRWESNHANVVFLSNENQPLALEERDRRYMVIYTPTAEDGTLYARVAAFLESGGLAKWLHFLQHYPLDDFTRHAKPLMTRAKSTLVELGWTPAQKFSNDWLEGFLPLPIRVCSAEQLYAAFRRWADQSGERFIPPRDRFTREVERFVGERIQRDDAGRRLPPRLTYKVINLKAVDGTRKAKRCWLPAGCEAPEGVSEGEWARESCDEFDVSLRAYTRRPGIENEGDAS